MKKSNRSPELAGIALATFIRSGSANGDEGMRQYLLNKIPLFVAALEAFQKDSK